MRISVTVLLCLVTLPAAAVEPLTSEVLIRQCAIYDRDTVANEAVSCRAWVHGFIGGAFASRTAKLTEPGKPETYSERATRTRLGRDRLGYGRNAQASYCIPRETTLDEIIGKLNSYSAELKKIPEHANQLLLNFLRVRYACPKQD